MAEKIRLVRNDTAPQIRLTITDQENGDPVDLTGGTVTLHFRALGSTTVLFSRAAIINPDTADQGIAIIAWNTGDLDLDAGDYEGEVEVVKASGARETIYDILKFKIREEFA